MRGRGGVVAASTNTCADQTVLVLATTAPPSTPASAGVPAAHDPARPSSTRLSQPPLLRSFVLIPFPPPPPSLPTD